MSSARLWEIDHDYYCTEGNFYSNDCHFTYRSWAEFNDEMGGADNDLNLVYRWDWQPNKYCGTSEEIAAFHAKHDDNYRGYQLLIFSMQQRKARAVSFEVEVCRADEPAVIAWLQPRLDHLMNLWQPLGITATGPKVIA